MKIWQIKIDDKEEITFFNDKPFLKKNGIWDNENGDSVSCFLFPVPLNPLQIAEITVNENGTWSWEIEREIGWYLTVCKNSYIDSTVVARYWNGTEWKIKIGSAKWAGDDIIKVVSGKLDNEYLKSLE